MKPALFRPPAPWLLLWGIQFFTPLFPLWAQVEKPIPVDDLVKREDTGDTEPARQDPHRTELMPLPALGGNSDMGFLFGAVLSIAHFDPRYTPYHWQSVAIAVLSVKSGPDGAEIPTYAFVGDFDFPGLACGKLRIKPMVNLSRMLNMGYYGLGNQSQPLDVSAEAKRPNEYIGNLIAARIAAEWKLGGRLKLSVNGGYKYTMPESYAGSQLETDSQASQEIIYGTSAHGLFQLEVGVVYDSRDHEVVPTSGMFHKLSARASPLWYWGGSFNSYGGATGETRFFFPLAGRYLVAAFRLKGDLIFGTAPFYELRGFGMFSSGFAGANSIRGLPQGRYHGQIKVLANVELRSLFVDFRIKETHFAVGLAGFFDTGRIWAGFEKNKVLNGSGLGLKLGTGGGLRVKWGEAICLRFDVAYSPDATDAPGGMPVGLYMEMLQAF